MRQNQRREVRNLNETRQDVLSHWTYHYLRAAQGMIQL